MTIKKAIELAMEQGYSPKIFGFANGNFNYKEEVVLLDRNFWISLGKAMGWKDKVCDNCGGSGDNCCGALRMQITMEKEWLYHWHKFIDHLAEDKTIESYFTHLEDK